MIKSLFKIFGLTLIVATFFSCTKDIGKLQQLNAVPAGSVDTCTTNVKYAQQIVPIMNANCAIPTCHVSSGGYIDYSTYTAIKNYLDGGKSVDETKLEEQCKHSSDMEKLAAEAERSSIKYKQVQFLTDKIGQEFDGKISGVTEWGIFVEIIENHCEGMIRQRDLTDDNYYFDEDNYCMRGKKFGRVLTLGDEVRIEVKRADLVKKQLDFALVDIKDKKKTSTFKKQETKTPETKKEEPKDERPRNERFQKKDENTKPSKGKNFDDEWGFEI